MGDAARKIEENAPRAIGWVSLAAFARDVLGTEAASAGRAGRDWCRARGVPYVRDGKNNLARVVDIQRAIERLAAGTPANDARDAAVAAALREMK